MLLPPSHQHQFSHRTKTVIFAGRLFIKAGERSSVIVSLSTYVDVVSSLATPQKPFIWIQFSIGQVAFLADIEGGAASMSLCDPTVGTRGPTPPLTARAKCCDRNSKAEVYCHISMCGFADKLGVGSDRATRFHQRPKYREHSLKCSCGLSYKVLLLRRTK